MPPSDGASGGGFMSSEARANLFGVAMDPKIGRGLWIGLQRLESAMGCRTMQPPAEPTARVRCGAEGQAAKWYREPLPVEAQLPVGPAPTEDERCAYVARQHSAQLWEPAAPWSPPCGAQRVSGPLVAEPGRVYVAEQFFERELVDVRISVDEQAAECLREMGVKLDVRAGMLVDPTGQRYPLWPDTLGGLPGTPRRFAERPLLVTDGEIRFMGLNPDGSPSLFCVPHRIAGFEFFEPVNAVRTTPLELDRPQLRRDQLTTRVLTDGMTISGVSDDSIAKVEKRTRAWLGDHLSGWSARRRELERRRSELLALDLPESAPRSAQRESDLVARIGAALGAPDAASWTYDEAKGALEAEAARLMFAAAEVEIVVIPPGAHFVDLPQIREWRRAAIAAHGNSREVASRIDRELEQSLNSVGCVTQMVLADGERAKTFVFVAEDGSGPTHHELTHWLEKAVLTPEQRARVDRAYEEAVRNNGPFASTYGMTRGEYLASMAELFGGSSGPEGVAWLKDKAPAIYEVLSELTGQRP